MASPLYTLLKKGVSFVWGQAEQNAFQQLRESICEAPILSRPDFTREFIVTTDASIYGLGVVLSQLDDEGEDKPILYLSRTTTKHEKNYATSELECLAVVYALKSLRHYLLGKKFVLYTDHSALTSLLNKLELKGKFQRWVLEIMEFAIDICYKPGKSNVVADALSRAPVQDVLECRLAEPKKRASKYQEIAFYLQNLRLPDDRTPSARFKKEIKNYAFIDGSLFFRKKNGSLVKCVFNELEKHKILAEFHDGRAHFGIHATYVLHILGLICLPTSKLTLQAAIRVRESRPCLKL